jgi:hypothetical protein
MDAVAVLEAVGAIGVLTERVVDAAVAVIVGTVVDLQDAAHDPAPKDEAAAGVTESPLMLGAAA